MNRSDALSLAVVGHTNTGKTSLLRTLTRDSRFGEVSDRAATTRDVQGAALLANGKALVALYDTPGLEDASALLDFLDTVPGPHADPVARIEVFLAGDHDQGRFEQEAKVLRQLLRSEAALYVIDAREPVLAKHRDELRVLAECGRPLLPVLNFTASVDADPGQWRSQLARMGLHVIASFDTVLFDFEAEHEIFEKLGVLLESRRSQLERLSASRDEDRNALILAASRSVAELLVNVAGLRLSVPSGGDEPAARARLQERVRAAEQTCVDTLLGLFRFELSAYEPPQLPLQQGRWQLDPFGPEAMRILGVRTGSAAAAGGMAGLTVDAFTGGLSLGAAALIGAGLGAVWGASGPLGREISDRLRGHHWLVIEAGTLAVLAGRQTQLLRALLRRGHAAQEQLRTGSAGGWPSPTVARLALRARAHPEWSALNNAAEEALPDAVLRPLALAIAQALDGGAEAASEPVGIQ